MPHASGRSFAIGFYGGLGDRESVGAAYRQGRAAGRSHKHSLQTDRCPERNLPDNVDDRADLAGKTVTELFAIFCEMADITHLGTFFPPTT
jgi:hypothetical protein